MTCPEAVPDTESDAGRKGSMKSGTWCDQVLQQFKGHSDQAADTLLQQSQE